jgi:hypothetical protein
MNEELIPLGSQDLEPKRDESREVLLRLNDGAPIAMHQRVRPVGRLVSLIKPIGTVVDWELCQNGDVEVRWDHNDCRSWWPARRLRQATSREVEALS